MIYVLNTGPQLYHVSAVLLWANHSQDLPSLSLKWKKWNCLLAALSDSLNVIVFAIL